MKHYNILIMLLSILKANLLQKIILEYTFMNIEG